MFFSCMSLFSVSNLFSPSLRSNQTLQPFSALRPWRRVCVECGDLDTTLSDLPFCKSNYCSRGSGSLALNYMQSSLNRFLRKRQAPAESNCGEEEKCQEKQPKTTEAMEDLSSWKCYEEKRKQEGRTFRQE